MSFTGDSLSRQAHAVCLAASALRPLLPLRQETFVLQHPTDCSLFCLISRQRGSEIAIVLVQREMESTGVGLV